MMYHRDEQRPDTRDGEEGHAMSSNTLRERLIRGTLVAAFFLAVAAAPAVAQDAPRALCFLESFEAEMEEDSAMNHAVEMEVKCAHAERAVLDVADLDLQFLDGEEDLIEAGIAWMKAHEEAGGRGYFSTQGMNEVEVSEVGRERTAELRAHSHAIPTSGIARLEGAVDLMIEADCVGEGAVEPLTVKATAGALRNGTAISLANGGEIVATERGQSGDDPMLSISGAGSYVALVDPPAGVEEKVFFGEKRLIVRADADENAEVTLRLCPSEVIRVPVSIEAAI
jgi:hypothetical protein